MWKSVLFLIFNFLTLKLSKTKEILFRWFVLCAWQRNYGHLLCGPLNQARCRCKYFVTQVWTRGFPVCIFCEVRTFCQCDRHMTTFSLSMRQSNTTMSQHQSWICARDISARQSGLGRHMSAAGAVPIKHCILMLPGSCPPPHVQYNANLVLTHSTKEWEVISALPCPIQQEPRFLTFIVDSAARGEV